jgi:hypothetical protein
MKDLLAADTQIVVFFVKCFLSVLFNMVSKLGMVSSDGPPVEIHAGSLVV